jgi:hypothetical protein
MLNISPEKIATSLLIIFNISLQQSKYPSNWKIAHVIAILKNGDTSLPSNYRPISFISCIAWMIFVSESNCGRVTFSSSSFDIELKYLFNNSHFSHFWDRPVPIFSDVRFSFLTFETDQFLFLAMWAFLILH